MSPAVSGTARRWAAASTLFALVLLSAVTMAVPAHAYQGTACATVTVTANPPVVNGGGTSTITATVTDCNGEPMSGVLVVFAEQSGPCAVTFNPPSAVTDANGVAHTTVTFPANCPCQYVISASVPSQNASGTVTVRENTCLPFTAAAPASLAQPASQPFLLAAILVALGAVLVGGGIFAFRRLGA